MKAQGFFGAPASSNKATKVRQVGNNSATPGVNTISNNSGSFGNMSVGRKQFAVPSGPIAAKVTVKQVGTHRGTGATNNHKQFRDPTLQTKSTHIGRPAGKERTK